MFMCNVGFYPCRAKLCVRQILPVTHPRFSPPMRHNRDNRDNIYLLEKGSVASKSPPFTPPLIPLVSILAKLYWLLIKFVYVYIDRCLTLQTYPDPTPTVNEEINLYLNTIRQRIIRFDTK